MANEKILIIDDDLDTLKLVGLLLQRNGYQIAAAKSGPQGIQKARQVHPDLILLDVMMPGMDGYETARHLRADPETASIPIIMFTAKSQLDDKLAGFESGADDYVTKPVHPAELLARVRRVLSRTTAQLSVERPAATGGLRGFAAGVLGAKGGVGVTTVALNLGIALRQESKNSVTIAEMRPAHGTLGVELGLESNNGLGNLLNLPINQITETRVGNELLVFNPGLRFLLASADPAQVTFFTEGAKAERITRHLKKLAPFTILDLGPGFQPWTAKLLPLCDHLLIVVDSFPSTLRIAQALIQHLGAQGFGTGRLSAILLNRTRSAMQASASEAQRLLGIPIAKVITPAPELAYQATKNHVPMIIQAPNSLTASQFNEIAKYLHEEVLVRA